MDRTCPNCGSHNEPAARFCSACGTALPSTCPRCGTELPAGAAFCPACGHRVAAASPEGERKLVTALFADLVDSTALAEGRDPERTRAVLGAYFSTMSAVVESWGGTIEKYIGDAIVALFGVPVVREDDAARALHAGLEMLDRLEELNATLEAAHGLRLRLRIGINSGEVMAGTEAAADQAIVAGDAVNVAARLQAAADPDGIQAGERTHQLAGPGFTWGERAVLTVKGRAEPVTAWPLLGATERAVQSRPSFSSPLVAREPELAILTRLLDDVVESRQPRLALVVGPPGIGKSRTVREFLALASAERPDLRVHIGRCPAVGQGITYWALGEVVRAAAGISLDDPLEEAAAKLARHVEAVTQTHRPAITAALATTSGIAVPDNPLDDLRPVAVAEELSRQWPRYIDALGRGVPLIILIEDLHWASEQLVEMVQRIASRAIAPLLIVATTRPDALERHPELAGGDAAVLTLRPLTVGQTRSLVGGLLDTTAPPADVVSAILERSDGNPFFVEEMLRALIDDGGLVQDESGWRARRRVDLETLPDTIHGVLAARIDALDGVDKRVLQEAAVVGRVFWAEPVALGVGTPDVAAALEHLERRGLILVRSGSSLSGHVEYAFKHALVRDVAYSGLARSRRARAHASVAGWLEELAAERHDDLAELMAFHLKAALDPEGADLAWEDPAELRAVRAKAVKWLLTGGAAARKRNAVARATEYHELALELADEPATRALALEHLAEDRAGSFRGDDAVPLWEEALEIQRGLLPDPEARAAIARIAVDAATMAALRWGGFKRPIEPDRIDAIVAEGLANADEEEPRAWLQALLALTDSRWVAAGRDGPVALEDRRRAGEAALAYAERMGLPTLEALSAQTLVGIALHEGDGEGAIAAVTRQLDAAGRIESVRDRSMLMFGAAHVMCEAAGRYQAMLERFGEAHRGALDLTPHDILHATYGELWSRYILGRWTEALPFIDEHLETFALESDAACPFVRSGLGIGALILAHRGETERGRELVGMIPILEDSPFHGLVEAIHALALIALGDPAGARAIVEPVAMLDRIPTSDEPSIDNVAMIETLIALGDAEALERYLPIGERRVYSVALLGPVGRRAAGWLALQRGDSADAERLLREALEGFREFGVAFEVARTQEMLVPLVAEAEGKELREAAARAYRDMGARQALGGVTPLS